MMFDEEFNKMIKKVDLNQNGQIEYSEFITCCSNVSIMMNEKYLKEAFELFDVDSNGYITALELKHILSRGTMNINIRDENDS